MKLDLDCSIVFQKNYDFLFNSDKRFAVNQGGSRSTKSYSICQLLILLALKEKNIVISIVRKTFPSLRATIMRDFFEILKNLNLYDSKRHNKTEHIYTFPNGSIIEFFSIDAEEKIRGRKRNYCFCDEANNLFEDDFLQLNLRTINKFFFAFNPSENSSWLYDLPQEQTEYIKSTYKDNPFLEEFIVRQIEDLKDKDEALYQIYALGERAITKENIYSNFKFLEEKPERFKDFIYAIDFGYVHPTALIKIWYYEDEVFVEEVFYESHLVSNQIIEKAREANISFSNTIIADHARPEIIADMQRSNFTVLNADKSVQAGINDVKQTKVFTNSKNLWKEYENYRYKKINGKITEDPVKLLDDALDALRYGVRYIRKYLVNQGEFFSIS
jgi:phage terminase large subunit